MERTGAVASLLAFVCFLVLLLAVSCALFFPPAPPIVWESYDFDDGLGNVLSGLAPGFSGVPRGFVGTPIEAGVSVRDFCVQWVDGQKVIWATGGLALSRSDDDGRNWQVVEDSVRPTGMGSAHLVEVDAEGDVWIATRGSVWRSGDHGDTWQCIYPGPPGVQCVGYNGLETDGSTIWAASDKGILTKIDARSGQCIQQSVAGLPLLDVLCCGSGEMYVSTPTELLVSRDGGSTFIHFSDVPGSGDLTKVDDDIWCTSDGSVVQIGPDGDVLWSRGPPLGWLGPLCAAGGYLHAVDGTRVVRIDTTEWNAVREIDLGSTAGASDLYADAQGGLYLGVSGRVLISATGGDTWEERPFGLSTVMTIASAGGQTWVGLEGSGAAVFRPDNSSWDTVGASLERSLSYNVTAIDLGSLPRVSLFSTGELAVTEDGGVAFRFIWFAPDDGSGTTAQSVVRDSTGRLFLSAAYNDEAVTRFASRIYVSTDDGESWSLAGTILESSAGGAGFVLAVDERRDCIWAAGCAYDLNDGCLFRGSSDGRSWARVDAMGMDALGSASLDQFGNLHVAGRGTQGVGIYRLNTEDHWSFIPQPSPQDVWPRSFAVDADGDYWLATEVGLYYLAVDGLTWVRFGKEDGLASEIVNAICVDGSGPGKVVWVGTMLGASRGTFVE